MFTIHQIKLNAIMEFLFFFTFLNSIKISLSMFLPGPHSVRLHFAFSVFSFGISRHLTFASVSPSYEDLNNFGSTGANAAGISIGRWFSQIIYPWKKCSDSFMYVLEPFKSSFCDPTDYHLCLGTLFVIQIAILQLPTI